MTNSMQNLTKKKPYFELSSQKHNETKKVVLM